MIGYWLVMGILACALAAVVVAVVASRGAPNDHQLVIAPDPLDPPILPVGPAPDVPPESPPTVAPIGDAPLWVALGATSAAPLSATADGPDWVSVLAASLPSPMVVRDLGVPGSTLVEARRDQLPVALELAPDLITVWFAASDLLQAVRLASHERDLDALLAACAAPNRQIVVANVPPLPGPAVPLDQTGDDAAAIVSAWNGSIARIAAAHGALVADLAAGDAFIAPADVANGEIRLSPAGHRELAERFRPAMVAALARVSPLPGPGAGLPDDSAVQQPRA